MVVSLLTLVVLVVGVGGCEVGGGGGTKGISLVVTRDFGGRVLKTVRRGSVPASETVMRVLQHEADVETRYGGGFVQAIDGLAGSGTRQVDWFYYVNGSEARQGAAALRVHAGDRIWWDRHSWQETMHIPAVVGSFPEPFRSGLDGKRLPVRVDCASVHNDVCNLVVKRLTTAGVPVARAVLGASSGKKVLRVLVGSWQEVRRDSTARQLELGPRSSGVFARPQRSGRGIALLDRSGSVTRGLGSGSGLIAATEAVEQSPTWVVTGTDAAGVRSAAAALSARRLRNHFALAISGGRDYALPEVSG